MLYEEIKRQYELRMISDKVAEEITKAKNSGKSDAELYAIVKKYYLAGGNDVSDQGAQDIKDEFDAINDPDGTHMVDDNDKRLTIEQQKAVLNKVQILQKLHDQGLELGTAQMFQNVMPRVSASIAQDGAPDDLVSLGTLKQGALGGLDFATGLQRGAVGAFGGDMSSIEPTSTNPIGAIAQSVVIDPLTPFGGPLLKGGKYLGTQATKMMGNAPEIVKSAMPILGVGGLASTAEDAQRQFSGQEGIGVEGYALGMAIPFAGAGVGKFLPKTQISANSTYGDIFNDINKKLTKPNGVEPAFTDVDKLAMKQFNKTSPTKTTVRSNMEIMPFQKDAQDVNSYVNELRISGGSTNLWDKFGSEFFPKLKQETKSRLDQIGSRIGTIDSKFLGQSSIPEADVMKVWGEQLNKRLGYDLVQDAEGAFIVTPTAKTTLMTNNSEELKRLQNYTDEITRRSNEGGILDENLRAMEKAFRGDIDPGLTKTSSKNIDKMASTIHEEVRALVKDRVRDSAKAQKYNELTDQGVKSEVAEFEAKKYADDIIDVYNKDRAEYFKISRLDDAIDTSTGRELDFSDDIKADKTFQRGGTALSRVTSQVGDQYTKMLVPYAKEWLGVDLPKEVSKIKASYKLANTELSKKGGGFIGKMKLSPIESTMDFFRNNKNLTQDYMKGMMNKGRTDYITPNYGIPLGSISGASSTENIKQAKQNELSQMGKLTPTMADTAKMMKQMKGIK